MRNADHAGMVIEHFAEAEIDALDSAATWREIARAAIHKLAAQHAEILRLRVVVNRLSEQLRNQHRRAA